MHKCKGSIGWKTQCDFWSGTYHKGHQTSDQTQEHIDEIKINLY